MEKAKQIVGYNELLEKLTQRQSYAITKLRLIYADVLTARLHLNEITLSQETLGAFEQAEHQIRKANELAVADLGYKIDYLKECHLCGKVLPDGERGVHNECATRENARAEAA